MKRFSDDMQNNKIIMSRRQAAEHQVDPKQISAIFEQ